MLQLLTVNSPSLLFCQEFRHSCIISLCCTWLMERLLDLSVRWLSEWQGSSVPAHSSGYTVIIVFFHSRLPLCLVRSYYWLLNEKRHEWDTDEQRYLFTCRGCIAGNHFCFPNVFWYVKLEYLIVLSKNFKEFQWHGKKRCSPCSAVSWCRLLAHSVTLRSSLRPHPVTLCAKLDVSEADRDIIHQPLHLGLMACRRQTRVMCAYHIPTYSFYVRISAGSTVSRLTNGFSNPLVCWKFFQPPVLKPKPKMYLNTSVPLDSCLSRPPAER